MTPGQAIAPKLNMNPTPQISNNPFADFFSHIISPKVSEYLHNAANTIALPAATDIQQFGQMFGGKPVTQDQFDQAKQAAVSSPLNPMTAGQAPEGLVSGMTPTVGDAITGARMAGRDMMQGVRGAASDIIDNTAARQGGFQSGSVGFPDSGTSTSNYPYQTTPNSLQKFGEGQNNDVRQIRFKGSSNAPALEENANNTLDRLGIKGSAHDQLAQINQQVKPSIYNWIKTKSSMATAPKDISISDIKSALTKEVQSQFGSNAPKGQTLDQIVNQHLNDVFDRASQEMQDPVMNQPYFNNGSNIPPGQTHYVPAPGLSEPARYGYQGPVTAPSVGPTGTGELPSGSLEPKTINSQSVYNMKIAANNTPEVSSAFDKIRNGQAADLTSEEKIALAGRNAYDKVLAQAHPDVKQATQDLSVLNNKNVYQSLESARFHAPAPTDIYGKVVPPGLQNFLPGSPILKPLVNNALTTKTGLGILGATGAGAAGTGLYLAGKYSNGIPNGVNNSQNNPFNNGVNNGNNTNGNAQGQPGNNNSSNHDQNISNPYTNVKVAPGESLDQSSTPSGQSAYMTQSEFEQAVQGMSPASTQYKIKQQQYKDDQARANANLVGKGGRGDLTPIMKGLPDHYETGNQVYNNFAQMPTSAWNGFKVAGLDASKIRAYLDSNPKSPYSQELRNVDDLNNKFAGDYAIVEGHAPSQNQLLSPSDGATQTFQKWLGIQQFFKGTWSQNKDAYFAAHTYGGTVNNQGEPAPVVHPAPKASEGINPGFIQDNFPTQ